MGYRLPTPPPPPEATYVLSASGPDRIGFVASVAAFCADHRINILDLATQVAGETYIMILLVDLSRGGPIEAIQQELAQFSQENGLEISLQHHDIFKATNEINMQ
jgi:glycine cleavage system transcriptional repressor